VIGLTMNLNGTADAGDHLADYQRHGFAVVQGVFGADDVAELAAAFDHQYIAGLTHPGDFRHGNLMVRLGSDAGLGRIVKMVQWPSYTDAVLAAFRTDMRLYRLLAPLLGSDIKQIINQLHWKQAGSHESDFAFHQDARFRKPPSCYRDLATSYVQTGIAVDPHTVESGALRVLPGSHRLGLVDLGSGAVMGDGAPEEALALAGLDPAGLTNILLEPGDVAFWNPFLIHGSRRNRGLLDRRFYLNGYVRAADCDRGEWAWRDGLPCPLGAPVLVHYEQLLERPEPHYVA
jgi:ectoine hydroxylase-related dioxygenase (phytanoyl-CoA dioxygenase family)